jgi:drug/metabolite transporter (DMT)-like permease
MSKKPKPLDRAAILLMLGLCASWGLNQVATKIALADVPPITQSALRSIGASLIVGAYAIWREPAVWRRDGTLGAGIAIGLLFSVEFILLYLGVQWTSAARAILFLYTAPFFFALGAIVFLPQERLRLMQWLGLALAFCGVAAALLGRSEQGSLIGDIFALLAAAVWGATTVLVRASALRAAPPTKVLLYQVAISAIVTSVVAFAAGESLPTHISALSALALLYQTVWVVGVTYLAWFWLVAHYRAGELSAFTFLSPVIGVLAGHFILGDDLSRGVLAALALVAGGIVLVNRPIRRFGAQDVRPDPE